MLVCEHPCAHMNNTWFPTIAELEAYDRVRHHGLGARRLLPSEREHEHDAIAQISQIFATALELAPEAEQDPRSVIVELD